jgi:hypothetical protein
MGMGTLIAFVSGIFVGALVIVIWALCAAKKEDKDNESIK